MQASHTGTSTASTARVKGAAGLTIDKVIQKLVERRLKDRLESAEDEITTGRGVHDETEMVGYQVFGKPIAFDPGEGGETPDDAMRI